MLSAFCFSSFCFVFKCSSSIWHQPERFFFVINCGCCCCCGTHFSMYTAVIIIILSFLLFYLFCFVDDEKLFLPRLYLFLYFDSFFRVFSFQCRRNVANNFCKIRWRWRFLSVSTSSFRFRIVCVFYVDIFYFILVFTGCWIHISRVACILYFVDMNVVA